MRKLIFASLVAASMAAASLPAAARTNVDFFVSVAPPAAPVELIPAPRLGFSWVPGCWDWRHDRYHWMKGRWVRNRPGHFYEPARWVHRDGRYHCRAAGWRDADRDGVPDRFDRAPRDPRWR